jgi:hypothetical protein
MYACIKHLGMSREDVLRTPVYERRFYIQMLIEANRETEQQLEEIESKKEKGKKVTTLQGEALRKHLKENKNP